MNPCTLLPNTGRHRDRPMAAWPLASSWRGVQTDLFVQILNEKVERETGFEPATSTLARSRSTK